MKEALNINLFAGPGTGKSTLAAGLFYLMKILNYDVEITQEYAKDLVYGEDDITLGDQLKILGESHHKLHRLINKVEFIIHDSPFIMGLVYRQEGKHLTKDMLSNITVPLFKSYRNLNIFLERGNFDYQENGRTQTNEEAIKKDNEIKNMLIENDIVFISLPVETAIEKIIKMF